MNIEFLGQELKVDDAISMISRGIVKLEEEAKGDSKSELLVKDLRELFKAWEIRVQSRLAGEVVGPGVSEDEWLKHLRLMASASQLTSF